MRLHRYEKYWLYFGVGALVLFLATLGVSAFAMGFSPPGHGDVLDPTKVEETPPFDEPGLVQVDENTYVANIVAMTFGYTPNELEVPVGSTVIFRVTSKDVVHSFSIPKTNVNIMVTPGYVGEAKHTFTEPGSYLVLCNEYCGTGHHFMQMTIEVSEP